MSAWKKNAGSKSHQIICEYLKIASLFVAFSAAKDSQAILDVIIILKKYIQGCQFA